MRENRQTQNPPHTHTHSSCPSLAHSLRVYPVCACLCTRIFYFPATPGDQRASFFLLRRAVSRSSSRQKAVHQGNGFQGEDKNKTKQMSAFPMQEVYEMDGIAVHPVHRLSPIYQQQQVLAPGHHHVPITPGMPLLPVHHQHRMMQPSASTYDGRVMTTTPVLTYQTSPQPPQSTYTTVVYPQPVLVIDPLSAPQFQDRIVKMDYIRKVLGVLFTQIGLCFLIVNVFNLR